MPQPPTWEAWLLNDTPQPHVAHLTLLATGASVQQRVEEQLEGGGWAQVVQQL